MSTTATFPDGATLEVLGFDGREARVRSPRPFAPGQPIRFTLALSPPLAIDGRTQDCKRDADARFVVRLRLVALGRADRERWLASVAK